MRHGDLGPWNTIWRHGELVGLIDWDLAEPGTVVEDLAQAAWYGVPLRDDDHASTCGFSDGVDRRARLAALCAGHGGGSTPASVVAALDELQRREAERIAQRGARGEHPWALFYARGDVAAIARDRRWLATHAAGLI